MSTMYFSVGIAALAGVAVMFQSSWRLLYGSLLSNKKLIVWSLSKKNRMAS